MQNQSVSKGENPMWEGIVMVSLRFEDVVATDKYLTSTKARAPATYAVGSAVQSHAHGSSKCCILLAYCRAISLYHMTENQKSTCFSTSGPWQGPCTLSLLFKIFQGFVAATLLPFLVWSWMTQTLYERNGCQKRYAKQPYPVVIKHSCGKSLLFMGTSTINGHVQQLC